MMRSRMLCSVRLFLSCQVDAGGQEAAGGAFQRQILPRQRASAFADICRT